RGGLDPSVEEVLLEGLRRFERHAAGVIGPDDALGIPLDHAGEVAAVEGLVARAMRVDVAGFHGWCSFAGFEAMLQHPRFANLSSGWRRIADAGAQVAAPRRAVEGADRPLRDRRVACSSASPPVSPAMVRAL